VRCSLIQMLPSQSALDLTDCGLPYAIPRCAYRLVANERANLTHLLWSQLRSAVALALRLPIPRNHVCDIFGLRSKPEMFRVAARPDIARVQHLFSARNATNKRLEHSSMDNLIRVPVTAIPRMVFAPCPHPTSAMS
jgi:hypothetical protein